MRDHAQSGSDPLRHGLSGSGIRVATIQEVQP